MFSLSPVGEGRGEGISPQRRLAAKMLPDGTFPRSRHHHLPVPRHPLDPTFAFHVDEQRRAGLSPPR